MYKIFLNILMAIISLSSTSAFSMNLSDLKKDYFNAKTLPAYIHQLKPLFQKWEGEIPGFERVITRSASYKNWIWVNSEITDPQCNNASIVRVDTKIAACQYGNRVLVFKPWFDNASIKNQAGLLLHEYLVGHLLQRVQEELGHSFILDSEVEARRLVIESRVRQFVRLLFSDNQGASSLVNIFEEITMYDRTFGVKEYVDQQVEQTRKNLSVPIEKFCKNPYESIRSSEGVFYVGLRDIYNKLRGVLEKEMALYQFAEGQMLERAEQYEMYFPYKAFYSKEMVDFFLNVVLNDPVFAPLSISCSNH